MYRVDLNHNIPTPQRTMPSNYTLPASSTNCYTKRLPPRTMVMRHHSNTHHTTPHPRKHTPKPHPHQQHYPSTNAQPTPSPFALAHNRYTPRPMEHTMPQQQHCHNTAYLNSWTSLRLLIEVFWEKSIFLFFFLNHDSIDSLLIRITIVSIFP